MNGGNTSTKRSRPDRGVDGRFQRFRGQRINIESLPRLPTFPARWVLEDPRRRPYFVFWTSPYDSADLSDALRMEPTAEGDVLISTSRGEIRVGIVRCALPGGRGAAILYRCPGCQRPRRYLYAAVKCSWPPWQCQACSDLRWQSQGQYLGRFSLAVRQHVGVSRAPFPRYPWDPRAVSDLRLVAGEFPRQIIDAPP